MKKTSVLLIGILITALALSGCGKNSDTDVMPRDPVVEVPQEIVAESPSTLLKTSNSDCTIKMELNGQNLTVDGRFHRDDHNYVMVVLNDSDDQKFSVEIIDNAFNFELMLAGDEDVALDLYGGAQQYGTYSSILMDLIYIKAENGTLSFEKSPTEAKNKALFSMAKDPDDYLSADKYVQSDDAEIVSLAESITANAQNDYEAVRAIHDWVAENVYYDFDALRQGNYEDLDAKSVLNSKKSVCAGYANLFAALVRSKGIPCKIRSGFALGIDTDGDWDSVNINDVESNHAWNEVYVNGRWIIVDSTWNSMNKYENGGYTKGDYVTDIYFDATIEFLSLSHLLMEE